MQSDKKIQLGQEFRIKIPNDRIVRVGGNFAGTPIYIMCTSGTGLMPPSIVLIPSDKIAEITFQDTYMIGESHTFIVDEQSASAPAEQKTYDKPTVKKSIAGNQYFRAEIKKSQESLNQKFTGKAYSFDQSYFNRTIGQIVIQHRMEEKYGPLSGHASLFSGAGFGSLQAFSCALGYGADELSRWYLSDLLSLFKIGPLRMAYQAASGVISNNKYDRYKSSGIEKAIAGYFKAKDINGKRTNRDLTIKDCKKDVYIPIWDISRRTEVITKTTLPDMPIWLAVCSAMVDPLFFIASKKLQKEWGGLLDGDIVKNNDVYLKKYNPDLEVVSIGSPVRVWDKGTGDIGERSKLIKMVEIKHDTDLDWSRSCGSIRYDCNPVDELKQNDCSEYAIKTAQKSGNINV